MKFSIRGKSFLRALCCAAAICGLTTRVWGASLPANFSESLVASGLSKPISMAFAPDGRLFICEQGGKIKIVKNGTLLSTPFATLSVNLTAGTGLLNLAFDPNFNSNHYLYVQYTTTSAPSHDRVSRLTANGDVAVSGSEVVLFDIDSAKLVDHFGGPLTFRADGKLYVATGDNDTPANSQSLNNLQGKILRLNADGTIPTDNPFYNSASGKNRAIWALGLRNPFTFAVQPGANRFFINDVGENNWEEVDEGFAGANYGWPTTEGATSNSAFRSPFYAYDHNNGCAITGGAFYNPSTQQFPSSYNGKYFFADYCNGWIRVLDTTNKTASAFAGGISNPIDLKIGSDGSLYYLALGSNAIYRIRYNAPSSGPTISSQPSDETVNAGATATFYVGAFGSGALRYQWQRNDANISGATGSSYSLGNASASDNGAHFRCVVSDSTGSTTSREAALTVKSPTPVPTPTPTPTPVSGNGLKGAYFRTKDLIGASVTRTDSQINFNWGQSAPMSGIASDNFSIRWTGQVQAQYSQTYTFYLRGDDGFRLWVNNVQLVNAWKDQSATEYSGTIALRAGQKYAIKIEYYEHTVDARCELRWSSPSTTKNLIPKSQLFTP